MKLQDLIDAKNNLDDALDNLNLAEAEARNASVLSTRTPWNYTDDPDYQRAWDRYVAAKQEYERIAREPIEA